MQDKHKQDTDNTFNTGNVHSAVWLVVQTCNSNGTSELINEGDGTGKRSCLFVGSFWLAPTVWSQAVGNDRKN